MQSKLWMGHASEDVGDLYSKLKDDVAWRREWAKRVGLGKTHHHSNQKK
jgi:hypothetical protein